MPTNTGSDTSYKLTIPLLTEAADIQSALKLLAYGSTDDPATDAEIADNATGGNPGIIYYIKNITEGYAPLLNPVFTDSILFEGSTANAYETKLSVVDPTADRTITFPDATTTVVGTDVSQTLTNKTLTSPDINGGTVDSLTSLSVRDTTAAYDVTLAATSSTTLTAGRTLTLNIDNANRTLRLGANLSVLTNAVTLTGVSGGSSVTIPASGTLSTLAGSETLTNKTLTSPIISTISNTGTLTLPTSTDTLVGRATTDTLTNKTLTSPVIATISNTGTLTLPTSTDTLIGRATTDTLTNKSISGSTNTFSNIPNAATTAASINTASAIVARDSSGNFAAGTITASLSGNATSATNIAGGSVGTVPYQTGSGLTDFVSTTGAISGYVLKYNSGSAPTWVDPSGLATVNNALNSENVGVTNDTTNVSTKYLAWVDANTGNNPVKVTSTKLTFVPSTGNLTATKFNNLTLTSATTGFTIAGGTTSKTLTVSNTLTFAGTDSSTLNIGTGGTLGTAAFTASGDYQPIKTNLTTIGNLANAAGYLYNNGSGTFSYASITDLNTTYTFASGTTNGAFSVTPSGGTAQSVSIYGLGSAAYTASSDYATSSHNHSLNSLSNVTITSNTSGELLKWNGTAWINNTLSEAGIQPSNTNLTSIAGLANSAGYLYNNGSGTFSYANPSTSYVSSTVMTTLGDMLYGGASGVATRLSGPTTTGTYLLVSTPSGGAATSPVWTNTSSISVNSATSAGSATNATNATNINISTTDGNASDTTMYPVLVGASSIGNQAPHIDATGLAYNASTNTLSAFYVTATQGFTGNLTGTADSANAGSVYSTGTTTKTGNRRIFVGASQPDATNAYGQGALQVGDIWIDV